MVLRQQPAFTFALPLKSLPGVTASCTSHRLLKMSTSNWKTAVITGASGGIGAETAKRLSSSVPLLKQLIICARDVTKAEQVASEVERTGVSCSVVPVELASLASVRECASTIKNTLQGKPLDLLINNAGVMACPLQWTQDGIEQQYGVNCVASALLTRELMPALREAVEAKVIFVSSLAVTIAKGLKQPPLVSNKQRGTFDENSYGRWQAYSESKLAMCMFAKALARREGSLTSVSLHPGVVQTDLGRHIVPSSVQSLLNNVPILKGAAGGVASLFGVKTPIQGAQLTLEIAAAETNALNNGGFYVKQGLEEAAQAVAPLLQNEEMCFTVYDDIMTLLSEQGEQPLDAKFATP